MRRIPALLLVRVVKEPVRVLLLEGRPYWDGKFLARTVQVMMVVAAGMPILALTLLWGGVAVEIARVVDA